MNGKKWDVLHVIWVVASVIAAVFAVLNYLKTVKASLSRGATRPDAHTIELRLDRRKLFNEILGKTDGEGASEDAESTGDR